MLETQDARRLKVGDCLVCRKFRIEITSIFPLKTFILKKGYQCRVEDIFTDSWDDNGHLVFYIKISRVTKDLELIHRWLPYNEIKRHFYLSEKEIRLAKLKNLR